MKIQGELIRQPIEKDGDYIISVRDNARYRKRPDTYRLRERLEYLTWRKTELFNKLEIRDIIKSKKWVYLATIIQDGVIYAKVRNKKKGSVSLKIVDCYKKQIDKEYRDPEMSGWTGESTISRPEIYFKGTYDDYIKTIWNRLPSLIELHTDILYNLEAGLPVDEYFDSYNNKNMSKRGEGKYKINASNIINEKYKLRNEIIKHHLYHPESIKQCYDKEKGKHVKEKFYILCQNDPRNQQRFKQSDESFKKFLRDHPCCKPELIKEFQDKFS